MNVPHKWRPRLGIITAATLASVLALPLFGLGLLWLVRGRSIGLGWKETAALLALVLPVTALIGFVFHRTLTRPVQDLIARTEAFGKGKTAPLPPLPHHGTAELAQLAQSFLGMAERLDARSAYLSSFAAHVSHALKSPLTAIQGAAELLRDALDPDEPAMTPETQRRFLSNIIADTDRLTRLLAQLRDLARAETLPTPGACTLAAFLPDWAETLAGLKVTWNGDIETGVALPAESLQMVLGHLAENAAQHGAQRLSLDAKADGAVLSLRVCDDGPGIDPQNRDQIFESFFTTQQTRGGTGLGLAIVRASLGAYRGTITLADSGPLPGACFVIFLPRNQ